MTTPRNALWQYQQMAAPVIVPIAVAGVMGCISGYVPVGPTQVQYQGVAGPVKVTQAVVVPALSWQSEFQDILPRTPIVTEQTRLADVDTSQLPTFTIAGVINTPVPLAPDLTQYQDVAAPVKTTAGTTPFPQQTFADLVPVAVRLTDGSAQTQVPQTIATLSLSWAPRFVDTLGIVARLTELSRLADVDRPMLPVPPTSWAAKYPDRVPGPAPLVDLQAQPTILLPYGTERTAWKALYPDWLPQPPRAPEFPAFTTGVTSSVVPTVRPLVWKGVYPDRAPGAAPLVDLNAQPTVLLPYATERTAWHATYPDWLPVPPRVVEFPAFTTGVTSSVVPPPLVAWQGRYPDVAPGPRPLADWQTVAFDPFPFPVTVDRLGWRGDYPDWLPLGRPTEYPAWTTGALSPALPLPAPLAWLGRYADVAPGPKPLADWQTLAFDPIPFTIQVSQMGWRGAYPDWLPLQRPTEYPAFATGSTQASLPLVRPLVWQPDYPASAPGAQGVVAPPSFVLDPFPRTAAPLLSWSPEFADMVARLVPLPLSEGRQPYAPAYPVATFWWRPVYPDKVDAARRAVETDQFAAYWPFPIAVPTSQLGWRGGYPDWLPVVRPTEYPAFVTGSTASSIPLVRPVVWLGRYPDMAPGARVAVETFPFEASLYRFPLPVPVAQLGWRGNYPDWFPVLRPTEWQSVVNPLPRPTVPALIAVSFADFAAGPQGLLAALQDAFTTGALSPTFRVPALSWKGIYADRAPGKPPLPDWQTFAWSEFEVTRPPSPLLAWQGRWADFAYGKPPLPVGAMPSLAFFKPLVFFGPEIIRFTMQTSWLPVFAIEMVAQPTSTPESSTQPKVTAENVTQPSTLDNESQASFDDDDAEQ